ncbi:MULTISPECIES: DNA repair protein RecN [Methylomonas]|uniref:DNA repair protein RecN n=2 Tax=Methylomonas TaxID=416 RepID=A0A140E407_9GAMM|nr:MULTISPECIES: DNA repair protein RecN [Methylomonas]AMK75131.1 DNA repair protein RecN [Methylomonas denitrificans]OAI02620.1 DNA repair protein RecN [Methylomonas methanica]TCV83054.1 DNA replication and repair protein RecN [Methylomonas methanica]
MLLNLNIIDLAVVDALDLDLDPGMSVLTGETGAGKSILLTALGLALGDRADSGYVRPGSKRAEVNIEFDLSKAPLVKQWLIDNELDDDGQCMIRRTISDDGRSKAYINNRPVNLQTLQGLSRQLVEIHGQHAHLTLLDSEEQRRLLDGFAGNQALLDNLNSCYQNWKQAHKQLQQLLKAGSDQAEREELLRYQLDELQQLDLENFDYQALADEHHKLANLGKILGVGQQQLDILYDNDQQSVADMLGHVIHAINELAQYANELNGVSELLSDAEIQIGEATQQLRRFLENQEADPQQLIWLENQIGVIQSLSRKHKIQPEELPELAARFATELDNLTHSSERIESLNADCERLLSQYRKLAGELSASRRRAGAELQQRISDAIKELGMPHGEFIVNLRTPEDAEPQRNGVDSIEFLVSTNPGLPAKPLAKVASGGELSRISLAIQVTTSTDKTTPTMIFDEVDSGIGGGIAEIVGQKLRRLSLNRQVLCVTHLPQVASQAHQHLFVAKNQKAAVTSSTVRRLSDEERVNEVARMLGGVTITENTLAHAREMLVSGGLTND